MAYFGTIPNENLPIICLSLFAAIGVVNFIITCRTRAWWMLLVPFTAFCEAAGYAAKIVMIQTPTFNTYVIMQCFLIIPPVFIAAAVYWALGKVMHLGCPEDLDSHIKPKRLAIVLMFSDAITLCIQALGAAIMSAALNNLNQQQEQIGQVVMLAGLGIQLVFFAFFTSVALYVSQAPKFGLKGIPYFKPVFFALFSSILFMFIRNVYRVVEFADGGFVSNVTSHEVFFYVFDSLMIFMTTCILSIWHFGMYLGPGRGPPTAQMPQFLDHKATKQGFHETKRFQMYSNSQQPV